MALETIWLVCLAPFFLFPSPHRVWIFLALPLLWAVRKWANGRFLPATPADIALFFLLSMVALSQWITFSPTNSLPKVAGLLYGIAIFYALNAHIESPQRLWRGVALLMSGGTAVAALSLVGTHWSSKINLLNKVITHLPKPLFALPGASEGFHPNQVAGALLWVLPLGLVVTAVLWRRKTKWVFPALASLCLMALVLLLTQSRGAWLGLGVALLSMISVIFRQYQRLQLALAGLLLLGFYASLVIVGPSTVRQWGEAKVDALFNLSGGNELTGRLEIWSRALWGIQDFAWTGMGMNNFRQLGPQLYPYATIEPDSEIAHAHNDFLQVALDLGLAGLIAYLAFWGILFAELWYIGQTAVTAEMPLLALGCAASLVAYAVYGLTDTVALGAKPGILFWFLTGLITSAYRLTKKPSPATLLL